MKCSVLGLDLDLPVAIAPMSLQKLAHPDGEIAAAKGMRKQPELELSYDN